MKKKKKKKQKVMTKKIKVCAASSSSNIVGACEERDFHSFQEVVALRAINIRTLTRRTGLAGANSTTHDKRLPQNYQITC